MNLSMQAVPDGKGGTTHQLMPVHDRRKGGPDPLNANPDAAAQALAQFVERIERLEEEKRDLALDLRDVYAEAKLQGYETKVLRQIVQLRRLDPNTRAETEALLETYKSALGIL